MSVAELCQELCYTELNMEVLTTKANGSAELKVESDFPYLINGVSVRYFPRVTKDHTHFSPALLLALYKIIKKASQTEQQLLIHVHSWWNLVAVLSTILGVYHRIPVILSPRGMITSYTLSFKHIFVKRLLHQMVGRHLLTRATIHATSIQEANNIKANLTKAEIAIIPNLVNLPNLNSVNLQNLESDNSPKLTLVNVPILKPVYILHPKIVNPSNLEFVDLPNLKTVTDRVSDMVGSMGQQAGKLSEAKFTACGFKLNDSESEMEFQEPMKLLFLSRIDRKKGLDLLFDALSKIDLAWHLNIGGDGETDYVNELKGLAYTLNIDKNIEWLGHIENEKKYELLQKHDLLVLISKNENFANVVIESLSVGTPVLISDTVGLAPYIIQSGLGWVCKANSIETAKTIEIIGKDFEKRRSIHNRAPEQIRKDFDKDKIVNAYLNLYKSSLKFYVSN